MCRLSEPLTELAGWVRPASGPQLGGDDAESDHSTKYDASRGNEPSCNELHVCLPRRLLRRNRERLAGTARQLYPLTNERVDNLRREMRDEQRHYDRRGLGAAIRIGRGRQMARAKGAANGGGLNRSRRFSVDADPATEGGLRVLRCGKECLRRG